jgi:hypothetical protein
MSVAGATALLRYAADLHKGGNGFLLDDIFDVDTLADALEKIA